MAEYRIPVATYRVQFNQSFRFADARELVPYWSELGISDLYSSPHHKARKGSSHGYDVANPLRINPELGTEQELDSLVETLAGHRMGLLLDIVPNHLAASPENQWWMDLLENGPSSPFAEFFDVNWHPAISKAAFLQESKILLPILHDLYGSVLSNQELQLEMDGGRLYLRHMETKLPLDPKTYRAVIEHCVSIRPGLEELENIQQQIAALPPRSDMAPEQVQWRREGKNKLIESMRAAWQNNAQFRQALQAGMEHFNGCCEDPRSFDDLDQLLSDQAYRLAHWKLGSEEINYRRFFDINELVGLRVELPQVFDWRHSSIIRSAKEGKITGLRIDHVDGLSDPAGYLERLQRSVGAAPRFYVIVEKILGRDETIPLDWAADGTTGYDFLNVLNSVFVHPGGWNKLLQIYALRSGDTLPFTEVSYTCMKKVITDLFIGDVNALSHELGQLAAQDRYARDVPLSELKEVLVEVTACLPVYRTYIRSFEISDSDRAAIEATLEAARKQTPPELASQAAFDFVKRVLLLEPPYYAEGHKSQWLRFIMRWQQLTGPVMAKGVEDTAFYRHCSLLSLNEVGGDPLRNKPLPELRDFHEFNRLRQERWPHSLNTTSTHDTKRGEDARARLNVLSEIPEEWDRRLEIWMRLNESRKRLVGGISVPDGPEELLIYQTLIASWPARQHLAEFAARMREFIVKAAREAKIHSSWILHNDPHERQLQDFVDAILTPGSAFFEDFVEFQHQIEWFGAVNALSQLLLKVTAPGIPDFYQGCELWNFAMVDPDNRAPVDYSKRIALLEWIKCREAAAPNELLAELGAQPQRDEAKLFLTRKTLHFRNCNRLIFEQGEYIPLFAQGVRSEHLCAFARKREEQWVAVVVPRWLSLLGCQAPDVTSGDWAETTLVMPSGAPQHWRSVWSGNCVSSLAVPDLLREFPVALLTSQ